MLYEALLAVQTDVQMEALRYTHLGVFLATSLFPLAGLWSVRRDDSQRGGGARLFLFGYALGWLVTYRSTELFLLDLCCLCSLVIVASITAPLHQPMQPDTQK